MDHAVSVQVLNSRADLHHVALDLKFMETFASAKEFVQALVLAQLQEDVYVLSVLKEVLKPDDIVVVQTAVDLDLRHQLLLGSALGEG